MPDSRRLPTPSGMSAGGTAESQTTAGWQRAFGHDEKLPAADLTVWLPGDVPLFFQRLPKDRDGCDVNVDEFSMGSRGFSSREEPRHRVKITQPFFIGMFPVTQHQWRAIASAFGATLDPDPSDFNGDMNPVVNVSWDDATQWCGRLQASGLLEGLVDRRGTALAALNADLPTEAQWEYACRAGTETEFCSGDGEAALREAGWFAGNSGGSTQPVGQLSGNSFGLYDMHGNVDEWCRDAWDEHVYKRRVDGACDPEKPGQRGADRVIRGGSWDDWATLCRSAARSSRNPGYRYRLRGFRVCLFSGPRPASKGAEPASVGQARRDDAAGPQ